MVKLQHLLVRKDKFVKLDLIDLIQCFCEKELLRFMVDNAMQCLSVLDEVISQLLKDMAAHEPCKNAKHASAAMFQAKTLPCSSDYDSSPFHPRFDICVAFPPEYECSSLRKLCASDIGRLVKVRGILTRVSDVMPQIMVVGYACRSCSRIHHECLATKAHFAPAALCTSHACKGSACRGLLNVHPRECRFVKYQELRLQELPSEVPVGQTPRSLTVSCCGELTQSHIPGNVIPVAVTGYV